MAWVRGPLLAGIVGPNSDRDMDVCLKWVLCVVTYRSLRPEESYQVWCVWVWFRNFNNEVWPTRAVEPWGKNNIRWTSQIRNFLICIFYLHSPLSLIVQNVLPSSSSTTHQIYFLSLEQDAEFYTSISSYQCKQGAAVLHFISPTWLPCTVHSYWNITQKT